MAWQNNYMVTLVYNRFGHHAVHSGYDRMNAYLKAEHFNGDDSGWVEKIIPRRVVRSIVWRAKVGAYKSEHLFAEMQLARKLIGVRREIFHFLYGEDAFCYSGFVPRLKNKKIVATYHQPPEYFEKVISRRNHLSKLDGLVTVSKNQYDYFSKFVDPEKIAMIPHGIDTEYFRPGTQSRKNKQCLFVGNWLRDFGTLRKVVETIKAGDDEVDFIIVTTVKGMKKIEGLKDADIRYGIDEEELLKLYQQSTMLVLPLEGCTANNSILEALSCGLPIVTTDIGGIRDYVDESCAVLAGRADAKDMAGKVLGLLNDKPRRDRMSECARSKAMQFAWPVVNEKLNEFYGSLYK